MNKIVDAPAVEESGGDVIVRRGLYFQVGAYPDKQFSLDEGEADAAIAAFAPVPLNVEHIPTIFDGKLGLVRRLWREGRDILAEYAIPRWLHEVTQGEALKISSEWNRRSKRAQGGAFVLSPRIADAVMQAAFKNVRPQGSAHWKFTIEPEKESDPMSLLSGIKALFQRVGVSSQEIDAHFPEDALSQELEPVGWEQTGEKKKDAATFAPFAAEAPALSFVTHTGVEAVEEIADGGAVGVSPTASSENFSAHSGENALAVRFAAMEQELAHLRTEAEAALQRADWAQIQAAQAQFQENVRALEGLVQTFRMTPAEVDAWQTLAHDHPAAFAATLPALQARPRLPQLGGETIRGSETADADRLEALTRQRMKEQNIEHTAAFKAVCAENRDLALSVRLAAQDGK